jgi:hypothetical protein
VVVKVEVEGAVVEEDPNPVSFSSKRRHYADLNTAERKSGDPQTGLLRDAFFSNANIGMISWFILCVY